MPSVFPGTTIEVSKIEQGASRVLFDGIFATGGITLSQVCIMSGLEPYLVQNWVKRGFVSSPVGRVYSKEQFARVLIINTLREALQIEKICKLIEVISGNPHSKDDDLICDDELYHRYVDMLAEENISLNDPLSVSVASERATEDFNEPCAGAKKQLEKILQVMLYADAASTFSKRSGEILASLQ